ncbi:MAG: Ig-like domain-containing domain [Planctomycetota bacterium]|jgi:hypothetical protein
MVNSDRRSGALRFTGLALAGVLAVSCGSGGGGGTSLPDNPQALKLVHVTANRRTQWERNQAIEFWFSAPLSKKVLRDNIINKAVQISITTANGRIPAKGSWSFKSTAGEEDRTRLVFDPTRTDSGPDLACADIPFGFEPLTTYDIFIPAAQDSNKFLTSSVGKPIIERFETFFTTGDTYAREIVQPRFVGVDGEGGLGFSPPRQLDGEVPYNAEIIMAFTEAMDPNSFQLGDNVSVVNDTLSTLQGQTVLVPGTFNTDPCGTVWTFRPAFHYGGDGYDISVVLTGGLKDLSGNPLQNPQTLRFRTEVRAGIPAVQVIQESFDNQSQMDTGATTADWNVTTEGVLQAGAVTTNIVTVALSAAEYPGGVRTRVRDHPFAQAGSSGVGHDQWVYTQAELGGAGAITDVGWGPSSNALFASSHTRVQVTLGHASSDALTLNLANNFDVGTPVKVVDTTYNIPQRATIDPPCNTDACAVGYWPMPAFTNFFEYNGVNNMILDVDATLGANFQITRIFFGPVGFPNRHTFADTGSNSGVLNEPVVTDSQFTKKRRTTIAQSLWYDSGQDNPNYSTPILSPASQSGGTTASIEFEGADGILFPIPGNPVNVVPDPTTFTGFISNVDQLDGLRFVRWRVTFVSNVNTGEVPLLNSVSIPYIF